MRIPARSTDERDDVASVAEDFNGLLAFDSPRLQRYKDYRVELESARWDRQSDPPVPTEDYGQRHLRRNVPSRHNVHLPFGQALTVKHTYRVAGRVPDVIVNRRQENAEERYRSDTMEKMVWGIIRESNGETQFADAAWDASQLGSGCFDLWMNPETEVPCFRSIDPASLVLIRGAMNPHEFERVYRFWRAPETAVQYEYKNAEFRGHEVDVPRIKSTDGTGEVTIVQLCDRDRLLRFVLEGEVGLYEAQHNYGFAPYVVIPNLGPERVLWGWSDYEFVRDLQEYMPRLYSRQADVIKAVAGGAYQARNVKENAETVKKIIGEGGVLFTGREGEVKPIEVPDIPPFLEQHSIQSVEFLKMLGFAPDAAWGDGQAGSGSDRGLQLQPQLELTSLKQIHWSAGLGRMFSMAFQIVERKQAGRANYRGTARSNTSRKQTRFNITLGPNEESETYDNPAYMDNPEVEDELIVFPRNPKELFDGDYSVRFVYQNRLDPEDPAFVLSEVTKFERGVQSLRTTLERLGFQAPEDEMRLIEQEAERFPWLRQGQIALIKAQLDASQQGEGGGAPIDEAAATEGSLDTMTSNGTASLDQDALAGGLPDAAGQLYGGA